MEENAGWRGCGWAGIKALCRLVDSTAQTFGVAGYVGPALVSVLGAGVSLVTGSSPTPSVEASDAGGFEPGAGIGDATGSPSSSSVKTCDAGGSEPGAGIGDATGSPSSSAVKTSDAGVFEPGDGIGDTTESIVTAAELIKKPADWGPSPVGSPLGGIARGTKYWFHWNDLDRPAPVRLPSKGYLPPAWVSSKNSMEEIKAQIQARKEAAAAALAAQEAEAEATQAAADEAEAAAAQVPADEAKAAKATFQNPFQNSNEEMDAIDAQLAENKARQAKYKDWMAKKSNGSN